MVLVSVLMSSYNHEQYIAEAIKSVLNQTFKDLELIIVDDCSTDSSREIIKKYSAKDQRVRAFFHEKNMGIAKTANDGLKEARGKFISFIGSDDVWVLHKLEKQLALINNNEDRVLWSEGEIIDSNSCSTGITFSQMHSATKKKKTGNMFEEIINDNYILGQSLLLKKEFVNGIPFDSNLKYLNDYRFMVDLASKHEFLFISEPLARYRVHGENSISKDRTGWLKDLLLLEDYILQRYSDDISSNLKGILYLKMGKTCSSLGRKDLAQQFYMKAISVDFFSKESILYLTCALTDAKGLLGNLLLSLYFKLNLIFELSAKIKQS